MKIESMTPIVTMITDFGHRDSYVAEMKAVLLSSGIALHLVDICHEVGQFDIEWGAFQLMRSYHHFPAGSWHLGVVDPGVGTSRRPVCVHVGEHHFVGPDNGLLLWAVRDCERRFNVTADIREIRSPADLAPTFHGRDLFAPTVVDGLRQKLPSMEKLSGLEGRDFPVARELAEVQRGEILGPDHFGNVITSVPFNFDLKVEAEIGESEQRIPFSKNYLSIEPDKVAIVRGSHGFWEFACRKGSAWEQLNTRKGESVTIYPLNT